MSHKIAIVGSQGKHWTPAQRTEVIRQIHDILKSACISKSILLGKPVDIIKKNIVLVSGGCGGISEDKKQKFDGGVDVWAEIVAGVLGISKDIKYPKAFIKEEFRKRNQEIAKTCDILYCIDPAWRNWSGGQWTMKMAMKMGKEVRLVLIE